MKRNVLVGVVSFVLFILLALTLSSFTSFDRSVYQFLLTLQTDYLTLFFTVVTFFGSTFFTIAFSIAVALALFTHKKRLTVFYLFVVGLGCLSGHIFKILIERARPTFVESGFSFPSGHTLNATLTYGTLACLLWKRNRLAACCFLVVPFFIGASRLYLGAHWFSDVIGAFLLGIGWIALAHVVFKETKL